MASRSRLVLFASVVLVVLGVTAAALAQSGRSSTPQGSQSTCTGLTDYSFFSPSRGMTIDFAVWEPPGIQPGETYPAIYYLHGSGGDRTTIFSAMNAAPQANGDCGTWISQMMQNGDLPRMYLIGIDDEGGMWNATNQEMVVNELPAYVEANFQVTSSRQGRHIQGGSMGAAGAIRYAAEDPDRYCSTSIHAEGDTNLLDDFWIDNQAEIRSYDVWARLVVGEDDTSRVAGMTNFYNLLLSLGIQATFEVVPNAGHSAVDLHRNYPNPRADLEFHAACAGGDPFPTAGEGTFDDDDNSVFVDDIEWLAAQGITNGCAYRRFCPDDFVSRGQMAAFIRRALPGLPFVRPAVDFTDDDNSTFEDDIEWLYSRGITNGISATTFGPEEAVTREQMAAFLHRALPGLPQVRPPVDFTDDNGSVFEDDIEWLYSRGITNGKTATTFGPVDYVTRGQMAAFLHRALTA